MKRILAAACAVVLITACQEDGVAPRVETTVNASPAAVDMLVGETASIQATVLDQHGQAFSTLPEGVAVVLSTSNASVVAVNGMQIAAVGAGTANVTVSAGSATPAQVAISVGNAPTALQVVPSSLTMTLGETSDLVVTILDQDGNPMTNLPSGFQVTASSQNSSVVEVNGLTLHAAGAGSTMVEVAAGTLAPVQVPVTVTAAGGGALHGSIAFDFSGDASGSFSLSASFDVDDIWFTENDWALTSYDSDYGSQDLIGLKRNGNGTVDFFWVWGSAGGGDGPVTSPGQRSLAGEYVRGWNLSTGAYAGAYWFESGSITFSAVAGQRLSGSFQATGFNEDTGAGMTLSNGSFDLPVLPEDDVWGEMGISPERLDQLRSLKSR